MHNSNISDDELIKKIKDERRWYPKAQLILVYHTFKQLGTKRPNKHTIENTASNIGLSSGYVSESLKLVKTFPQRCSLTREDALREIFKDKDK